jgi:hypothetical protein
MERSFTKPMSKERWFMGPLERAELLLAKAKDDETLLLQLNFDTITFPWKKKDHSIARKRWKWSSCCENGLKIRY